MYSLVLYIWRKSIIIFIGRFVGYGIDRIIDLKENK